jgi:hypothetical protein
VENWPTRTLEKKIDSMLFERTALSRKPEKLIEQELKGLREEDKLTPDLVFRDPYLLDFLVRWLDQNERRDDEDTPIGLILCAGKKEETVRLLDMEGSGIRVAAYWLEAVPREQLERKLHEAVALARQRLAEQATDQGPLPATERR